MITVANNEENPELGDREVPFSRELYIEREDFLEVPPNKIAASSRATKFVL